MEQLLFLFVKQIFILMFEIIFFNVRRFSKFIFFECRKKIFLC